MAIEIDLNKSTAKTSFDYNFLVRRMWPYVKPVLFRAFLGLLVALPLGLLDSATAFILKPYIDIVILDKPWVVKGFSITRDIFALAVPWLIIGFAIMQGFLKYLNNYLVDWVSFTISNAIKFDLFKKLTTMDSKFYDTNSSGIVLGRFLSDPDTASRSFITSLKDIITAATSAIGLIVVLLWNGWKLAIVGVVVLVCAFLPVALIRKRIKKTSLATMVLGGGINTNFNETYHGNKIITGYCLKEKFDNRFKRQIREAFELAISLTKRVGWMSPIMYLIASIGIAVVLPFGNHLIITGEMTVGSLASFITALLLLYKPVKTLGNTLTNIQNTFVSISRVFELFDLQPEIKDKEDAKTFDGVYENITFQNVFFEYKKGAPVLNNINLTVKKGEAIALVGNSGGGKSTMVNLLPRFYDVTSGSITIDGTDIRDYKITSLRGAISEVFQDNFLFSGTIRGNILMGKEDATDEEIAEVVKGACIDEFLGTLPDGIDTYIGERGTTLSGGQKQRVAIARAMIKNSPILVLDEATSALDNKSEAIVQKALENLMKDKTVFVIAHRLSTIQNSDKIAVINEGELKELGTHSELLKIENGNYRYLYEMQFQKTGV